MSNFYVNPPKAPESPAQKAPEEKPEPRPVEPAVQEPSIVNPDPVPEQPVKKSDPGKFLDFLSQPRDKAEVQPEAEKSKEDPAATGSGTTDSKKETDPGKRDPGKQFWKIGGERGFRMIDNLLPRLSGYLNSEDWTKYQAGEGDRKVLEEAIERWLEEKKILLTAGQELSTALFMVYGPGVLIGLSVKAPKMYKWMLEKMGMEDPLGLVDTTVQDQIKEHEAEKDALKQQLARLEQMLADQQAQAKTPAPAQPVKKQEPVSAAVINLDKSTATKQCKWCNQPFKVGSGSPKSKKSPMHDSFCSQGHYTSYGNKHKLFGKTGRKKKSEKTDKPKE